MLNLLLSIIIKMYQRKQLKILKERISEPRRHIQILSGPRQVGKTTIAIQLTQNLSIPFNFVSSDAVSPSNSVWIDQQWETARIKLENSGAKQILLIIDEIQKIENWSEVVKKNWDTDTNNKSNLKLLLLGSSNMSIQKGLTESLTGRFEVITVPHWSMSEMQKAFNISPEEYIYFGAYPGASELIKDEKRWERYIRDSIIETTISKDILQLTTIQKPALLKNLFELSCKYAGEILSYTKILGQLHDAGNTTTLAHYQELLSKSWMIAGIQKFSGSTISTRSSIPKWLVYNSALSSVYSEYNFEESKQKPEIWGRRVEQAIGAHLINQTNNGDFELYYWREGNDEVDFILKKGRQVISLEVKTNFTKSHRGSEKFNNKYKPFKNLLISKESLSWIDFLEIDVSSLFE